MALAFGLGVEEIERLVIGLIKSGEINARVDSRNKVRTRPFTSKHSCLRATPKIITAKQVDQRVALFARASETGNQIDATNRKLLLRMRL